MITLRHRRSPRFVCTALVLSSLAVVVVERQVSGQLAKQADPKTRSSGTQTQVENERMGGDEEKSVAATKRPLRYRRVLIAQEKAPEFADNTYPTMALEEFNRLIESVQRNAGATAQARARVVKSQYQEG